MKIDKAKLDEALETALQMPGNTDSERFHRTVKISNLKMHYKEAGMYYPPLDAKQRAVFDECGRMAIELGIERAE